MTLRPTKMAPMPGLLLASAWALKSGQEGTAQRIGSLSASKFMPNHSAYSSANRLALVVPLRLFLTLSPSSCSARRNFSVTMETRPFGLHNTCLHISPAEQVVIQKQHSSQLQEKEGVVLWHLDRSFHRSEWRDCWVCILSISRCTGWPWAPQQDLG